MLFISIAFKDGLRKITIVLSATNNGLIPKHFEENFFFYNLLVDIVDILFLSNEFLYLLFILSLISHYRLQWSSGDPIEHIRF